MADLPEARRGKKSVRIFLAEIAVTLGGFSVVWWWLGVDDWTSALIFWMSFVADSVAMFLWHRTG